MIENELRKLIQESKACLADLHPYTTYVAQLALEDMIQQAEAAVNQDENDECGLLPFTTKREFGDWHWNKEDACQFAKKRYTMASVWFEPGKAYSTYGLEDALVWFKTQDLRKPLAVSEINEKSYEKQACEFLPMAETCEYYEKICREFLNNITYGNSIGQYSNLAGEALSQALNQLTKIREENTDITAIAKALTACLNALWELRLSRVLCSESNLESGGNILLSAAQMEKIRHKIESDSLTKGQYEQIKAVADSASLEQRKSAYSALFATIDDYEQLNREFVIETSAGNRPSFAVPKGTVSASFTLRLPCEDNERDGLGHIQVWNIGLKASEGKNILLEGQLGALKDPDHGIYPMVTSSSTLAAYGAIGAGIPAAEIKDVVTVVKAYSSAVGAGAFVSEIFGDEADELRRRGGDGGEFGATTGRPRRMGWFDAVATRYGVRMQGTTEVALTVLDVLGYLDEIPMCVGYEIDGEVIKDFPTTYKLEKAKPVLRKMPGWKCDIRGIKNYEELPQACKDYIDAIEQEIQAPITLVSNGPKRHDIIKRTSRL